MESRVWSMGGQASRRDENPRFGEAIRPNRRCRRHRGEAPSGTILSGPVRQEPLSHRSAQRGPPPRLTGVKIGPSR
jgi:hypothetical protein